MRRRTGHPEQYGSGYGLWAPDTEVVVRPSKVVIHDSRLMKTRLTHCHPQDEPWVAVV